MFRGGGLDDPDADATLFWGLGGRGVSAIRTRGATHSKECIATALEEGSYGTRRTIDHCCVQVNTAERWVVTLSRLGDARLVAASSSSGDDGDDGSGGAASFAVYLPFLEHLAGWDASFWPALALALIYPLYMQARRDDAAISG